MIGVVLALVLAGPSLGGTPTSLETGPKLSGPADVNPFLPLFEFAPSSGVGLDPLGSCNCNSTNNTTFPQDFDNAAWTKLGVTSVAPVVTANFAQDPTGAFGADRVQFASCVGVDTASIIYQIGLTGSATTTSSVYCRATAGASQQISICAYDGSIPTGTCTAITCTSTSWTRFSVSRTSVTTGGIVLGCNNLSSYTGPSNTGTADVLLWGGNETVSASVQPYVAIPESNTGGTLVFSRTSTATCLKTVGTTLTNIANGDMVTCATGQARVMPGADGSPDGGLLGEPARTNSLLRSQELNNNGVWVPGGGGGALAPTVTADFGTAPDGTSTADRIQVPAIGASAFSVLQQTACPVSVDSISFFIKGNGTSGTFNYYLNSPVVCQSCSYNANSWTRCKVENYNVTAFGIFTLGNDTTVSCGSSAQDVLIWGTQCEAGSYASSYIATAGAAANRSGELADLPITLPSIFQGLSVANTVIAPSDLSVSQAVLVGTLGDGAPGSAGGSTNYFTGQYSGGTFLALSNGMGLPTSSSVGSALTGLHRYSIFHTGSLMNGTVDGVAGAGTAGAFSTPAFTRYRVGNYAISTNVLGGVTKMVCVDASGTRCQK